MRSWLCYWKRSLWDAVRYSPTIGAIASRLLSVRAGLTGLPLKLLALLARAARINPRLQRLRRLKPVIDAALDRIDPANSNWSDLTGGRPLRGDLLKALILKEPVSPIERGVLYVTFEDHFLALLASGHADTIARRYDLLLGPSCSPPLTPELLLMNRFWPGRLFTLLSNYSDADLIHTLAPRIEPIPLLASHWVNPEAAEPFLDRAKDYDIVMLAHFDPVKRHWLLFNALRRFPKHYRVLLMGVPLGGRTDRHLLDEARALGAQDRFDLLLKPTRAEIMESLACSRVSLVFSRQEGSCIAVAESLLAGTPVGLFRNAHIGSKAFINQQTGMLLDYHDLAGQLQRFVESAERFRPREWALKNIACTVSTTALNRFLQTGAEAEGRPWTRDIQSFAQDLVPAFVDAADADEMRPCHEEFAERYGLPVGRSNTEARVRIAA